MKALLINLWVLLLCFAATNGASVASAQPSEVVPELIQSHTATGQRVALSVTAQGQYRVYGGVHGAPAFAQDPDFLFYLPLIYGPEPGISGMVTYLGSPAAGIQLSLRFYNGSGFSTADTTFTDAGGNYRFANAPGLSAGQR
jgi:hypothetical protein